MSVANGENNRGESASGSPHGRLTRPPKLWAQAAG